jgi:hypothetical protein
LRPHRFYKRPGVVKSFGSIGVPVKYLVYADRSTFGLRRSRLMTRVESSLRARSRPNTRSDQPTLRA